MTTRSAATRSTNPKAHHRTAKICNDSVYKLSSKHLYLSILQMLYCPPLQAAGGRC